jgi:hypothetical protein
MIDLDFSAIIAALKDANVEFLIVGGLAAVLNGTPVNTFDVDVVHRRSPENVDRVLQVLETLDAVYRIQPERRLRPGRAALLGAGHQNLITKHGPLDVLGAIGEGLGYEELLPASTEMRILPDLSAHVLNLEALIAIKEQVNGEKDRAMLPILRCALERKNR